MTSAIRSVTSRCTHSSLGHLYHPLCPNSLFHRIGVAIARIFSNLISCITPRSRKISPSGESKIEQKIIAAANTVFFSVTTPCDPLIACLPVILNSEQLFGVDEEKNRQSIIEKVQTASQVVLILPATVESFFYFREESPSRRRLCPLYELIVDELKRPLRVIVDVHLPENSYKWKENPVDNSFDLGGDQPYFKTLCEVGSVTSTLRPDFKQVLLDWGVVQSISV